MAFKCDAKKALVGFKLWGLFLFLLWGRSNIRQVSIVKSPTSAVWETILGETRASVGQVMETQRSHQIQGMFWILRSQDLLMV